MSKKKKQRKQRLANKDVKKNHVLDDGVTNGRHNHDDVIIKLETKRTHKIIRKVDCQRKNKENKDDQPIRTS